jgi:hypothetical protein
MLPIANHHCHPYKYLELARLPIFEHSTQRSAPFAGIVQELLKMDILRER